MSTRLALLVACDSPLCTSSEAVITDGLIALSAHARTTGAFDLASVEVELNQGSGGFMVRDGRHYCPRCSRMFPMHKSPEEKHAETMQNIERRAEAWQDGLSLLGGLAALTLVLYSIWWAFERTGL